MSTPETIPTDITVYTGFTYDTDAIVSTLKASYPDVTPTLEDVCKVIAVLVERDLRTAIEKKALADQQWWVGPNLTSI